jgi:hypothetical protein
MDRVTTRPYTNEELWQEAKRRGIPLSERVHLAFINLAQWFHPDTPESKKLWMQAQRIALYTCLNIQAVDLKQLAKGELAKLAATTDLSTRLATLPPPPIAGKQMHLVWKQVSEENPPLKEEELWQKVRSKLNSRLGSFWLWIQIQAVKPGMALQGRFSPEGTTFWLSYSKRALLLHELASTRDERKQAFKRALLECIIERHLKKANKITCPDRILFDLREEPLPLVDIKEVPCPKGSEFYATLEKLAPVATACLNRSSLSLDDLRFWHNEGSEAQTIDRSMVVIGGLSLSAVPLLLLSLRSVGRQGFFSNRLFGSDEGKLSTGKYALFWLSFCIFFTSYAFAGYRIPGSKKLYPTAKDKKNGYRNATSSALGTMRELLEQVGKDKLLHKCKVTGQTILWPMRSGESLYCKLAVAEQKRSDLPIPKNATSDFVLGCKIFDALIVASKQFIQQLSRHAHRVGRRLSTEESRVARAGLLVKTLACRYQQLLHQEQEKRYWRKRFEDPCCLEPLFSYTQPLSLSDEASLQRSSLTVEGWIHQSASRLQATLAGVPKSECAGRWAAEKRKQILHELNSKIPLPERVYPPEIDKIARAQIRACQTMAKKHKASQSPVKDFCASWCTLL